MCPVLLTIIRLEAGTQKGPEDIYAGRLIRSPHRIQAAVASGPSGRRPPRQESSAGLQTVASAAHLTRLEPNDPLRFTAELSIKHSWG